MYILSKPMPSPVGTFWNMEQNMLLKVIRLNLQHIATNLSLRYRVGCR
jgi:hypothetical protein